jgi:thiol-disulfide isomerase/thioredoxin
MSSSGTAEAGEQHDPAATPGLAAMTADRPAEGPRAPRRPRPIFLVLGLIVAAALAVGLLAGGGSSPGGSRARTGSPVPSFSLPRLGGGGRVGVPADGGGAGRPAILLFFASWCAPCRGEIPALATTYSSQRAGRSPLAKVAVVGVDGSDPTSNALAFVRSSGVTFPVGADRTYTVTEGLFSFTALPEAVFVDADGRIAGIHYGALTTSEFVSWEHRLLASA